MSLTNQIDIITGITVLIGLLLAANEVRQFRQSRERDSALRLFETFQRPEFSKGVRIVFGLPDREFSVKELKEYLGEDIEYIDLLGTAVEGLGILVKNREIKLDLVEEFFGGPIVLYWKRLHSYMKEIRKTSGRESFGEYVQWLAERLMEKEVNKSFVPAHIEFKDWKE